MKAGSKPGVRTSERDPDPLGRDHQACTSCRSNLVVLHVDEGGVEAGVADDLDDLRIGDPADIGPDRESALAHDSLDSVLLHRSLLWAPHGHL